MPQRRVFKDYSRPVLATGALNILHTGRLSSATAYIPLVNCAALDFFRYHPITGLCSDCPVELSRVLHKGINMSLKILKEIAPLRSVPIPEGTGFTALFDNGVHHATIL